ncbi:MAG: thiol peroxidase [Candidatus Omnitrophica bacterium]|nr:thiol peroxidase [Candidatus Omnitrophota bacterium]MDD5488008.1 thiol peroxidase [Candidatus Omnitrophota bacterium]
MGEQRICTVKGAPVTLAGQELKTGERAPSFRVVSNDLTSSVIEFSGGITVIASVPSLDTPVCDLEIKRFHKEALALSDSVRVIFISMDLPFAQKRFCDDFQIKRVSTYSDHRDADFGVKYGVLINELRLLSRAVFVVDDAGSIGYVEYVPELTSHPDYDSAISAVKSALEEGRR